MKKISVLLGVLQWTIVLTLVSGQAVALDAVNKVVNLDMQEEPKNMDAQKAQDTIAFMVLGHIMEGLTRLDPKNRVIPAQAESIEELGPKKYRFKIRKNAVWSDGKPVTADDFVFAWQRGVTPKTASIYAFIFFPIKNAEKINQGKVQPTELGAKAIDSKTLEVELERPTGYFTKLLAFPSFSPARRDIVEKHGSKYAADANRMIFNGPWTLESWKHNASMKLVKNPKYWNAKRININVINMPYLIRDTNSQFNMVKDGKYDMIRTMPKELLADAQKSKMRIRKYNVGTVWYLELNTTRKALSNKWVRKALSTVLDRKEMAEKVIGIPGTKPAYGLIPDYMPAVKSNFGKEYSTKFKDGDVATAKKFLARGLKELGMKKLPKLKLLINDDIGHKRDAEYLQNYYKKHLGIDLVIDVQTFKVRLQKTINKDYDIVKAGWGPDYLDAMTFADLYTSWNKNNHTGWSSKKYDEYIATAMNSTDQKVRADSMHAADKILVDETPIINLFQAVRVYVQDPQLVGVLRREVAPDPDFYYARIRTKVAKK